VVFPSQFCIRTKDYHSYHGGSLIDVCLDFLNPRQRDCRHLELTQDSPEFKKLEKFLSGVRVTVKTGNNKNSRPKIIRGLKARGAQFGFTKADGESTTVEVSSSRPFLAFSTYAILSASLC
jgi:hypothetical protein